MYAVITLALLALAHPGGQSEPASYVTAGAVISAPVRQVWELFTTREGIETWQVARASEIELKPGARWRTSYSADSNLDDDTVIENEVLAVDPERMLATRTIRAPADFPFREEILETWAILYFEPISPTETRVISRMFGFTDDPASQDMRAFFEWGNAYELEELADHLAGPTDQTNN